MRRLLIFILLLIVAALLVFLIVRSLYGHTADQIPEIINSRVQKPLVILLHGLGRSPLSMRKMEQELTKAGFFVLNISYPSRSESIEDLSNNFLTPLIKEVKARAGVDKIDFVTHSLGGILVRKYALENGSDSIGRVVMLGPPNGGSEIPDKLKDYYFFRFIFGLAGQQLGTINGLPATLGPPDFKLAVIAGTNGGWNPLSKWFAGDNDGIVSVKSTQLNGMSQFQTVDSSHTFIMNNKEAIELTKRFLLGGDDPTAIKLRN